MSWWLILVVIIYMSGYIWGARRGMRQVYDNLIGGWRRDWGDAVGALAAGTFLGFLWPAPATMWLFSRLTEGRDPDAFIARVAGRTEKQRLGALHERELHVERLERELGIASEEESE